MHEVDPYAESDRRLLRGCLTLLLSAAAVLLAVAGFAGSIEEPFSPDDSGAVRLGFAGFMAWAAVLMACLGVLAAQRGRTRLITAAVLAVIVANALRIASL